MRRRAALAIALAGAVSIGARPAPASRCDGRDTIVPVPAGRVAMGEDGPGRPGRMLEVAAFRIDAHEVTNRQFAAFAEATGHRTQAEREGRSAVFVAPDGDAPLDDASHWWRFVRGADWRHPRGVSHSSPTWADEPVVHVDREDAAAYARWAGGRLPTAEEWERAARGDQRGERDPTQWAFSGTTPRANVWEGVFPARDTAEDGYAGIAPAGCFPANAFGLRDMIGNVWEWVAGDSATGLVKGGSYLCAFNYCANFRPAAFQAQERDMGTSHIGFRVAYAPIADRPRLRGAVR